MQSIGILGCSLENVEILVNFGVFRDFWGFGGFWWGFWVKFGVLTKIRFYWPFNWPADQSRSFAIDWLAN
jgi:hypothetical protein